MRTLVVTIRLLVLAMLASACTKTEAASCSDDSDCELQCSCSGEDSIGSVCETDEGVGCPGITCVGIRDCPDGMYCASENGSLGFIVTDCRRACSGVVVGDGSNQAACRLDSDCASGNCENELETSPCVCAAASSGNTIPGCATTTPAEGPGTEPSNGPCDQDSDCQSASCQDPAVNPEVGCTCQSDNSPPQIILTILPVAGVTTETAVSFDASGSVDLDGTIDPVSGYSWDFDSDGTVDATGSITMHTYPSPGEYIVTLEVVDDDGASSVETNRVVRVAAAP